MALYLFYAFYLYIEKACIEESSKSYDKYIRTQNNEFLEEKQYGIYENIRQIILTNQKNKNLNKSQLKNFKNLINHNQLIYEKLYLLNCCLNDKNLYKKENNDLFEKIRNLEGSEKWCNLFLFARSMNSDEKIENLSLYYNKMPLFLRNYIILNEKKEINDEDF